MYFISCVDTGILGFYRERSLVVLFSVIGVCSFCVMHVRKEMCVRSISVYIEYIYLAYNTVCAVPCGAVVLSKKGP